MPWINKRLRDAKVWARCDASGELVADAEGRSEVLYQLRGKIYRAAQRNLAPDEPRVVLRDEEAHPSGVAESAPAKKTAKAAPPGHIADGAVTGQGKGAVPADAIHVYTDGACTGNPGPMGLGVVVLDPQGPRRELSEYLGMGTNNVAELTAILRGLEALPRARTVLVYSDSAYALGLLGKGWKAKANQELVERLRKLVGEFRDLRLVKVAGHAGVAENERCDELARGAVLRRR